MTDLVGSKPWWQSRTVWTGIVGGLFSIAGVFNMLPAGLTSETVVNAILGVVSVAAVVFRVKATKTIGV
jgi:hypothetical protein